MRHFALLLLTVSALFLGGCVGSGDGLTQTPAQTVTTESPTTAPVSETPTTSTPPSTTTSTLSSVGGGQVKLRVTVVETIPENTTVVQYNTSSLPPENIKWAIDSARASDDGFESVSLSTSQASDVQKELDSFASDTESSGFGHYVRYQNETFHLRLIQLE
ncbi:hypothetical protein GJR96_06675 [Haloferax sp. MBLA0076]|uniref:Lipoprotein n=1 Tax=Haloferax litoreum TaxID=2666140 RepID=A0A6A8GFE8_9EURY|nr:MULTISPECIES: hypothetical protein [Haloferax]KAB1193144.1 hypothetical protein Hfx1148_06665 [Haloferax sp. CBA1148]MRX21639.1 hypothetical protein [Haloferax litoreum]